MFSLSELLWHGHFKSKIPPHRLGDRSLVKPRCYTHVVTMASVLDVQENILKAPDFNHPGTSEEILTYGIIGETALAQIAPDLTVFGGQAAEGEIRGGDAPDITPK